MKQKVYSIFDVKAQAYLKTFNFNHNGEALRAFEGTCKEKQSNLTQFPEDFKLYQLGEFDNVTGKFTSLNTPTFLANATDFTNKGENNAKPDYN